jgi:hypothetical protein
VNVLPVSEFAEALSVVRAKMEYASEVYAVFGKAQAFYETTAKIHEIMQAAGFHSDPGTTLRMYHNYVEASNRLVEAQSELHQALERLANIAVNVGAQHRLENTN